MSSAEAIPAPKPLTAPQEARVFRLLRFHLLRNLCRQILSHGRLRISMVVLLSAIMWFGLFVLFVDGFQFLSHYIADQPTHDHTVRVVYNVFFASLTVMLLISTAIIVYGGLYRGEEARYLLTTPTSSERVFLHKFPEAMFFSSSGFVLLGSPMLLAYGFVHDAPWPYFVMLLPFMLSFAYIAGSLGAMLCLLVMRFVPLKRTRILAWLAIPAAVLLVRGAWNLAQYYQPDMITPAWFHDMLNRLRFSEGTLLPNWWLSSGLLEAARGGFHDRAAQRALAESMMFLAVCMANALFLHQITVWLAGRVYRRSYQDWHGQRSMRRLRGMAWVDRLIMKMTWVMRPEMRLLIVKDLRLFRRDPVQWTQFLIFFGLLALYFFNTRWLRYDVQHTAWVNMVSFMNLSVVGLILSTFTTRFIFPLISLEGRRFWILGLLPIERDTILWGKYLFAACGSLAPSMLLVWLSDLMLRVSPLIMLMHLLVCVLLSSGLAGIAVGLGAKLPNLREDSPSRIAAGFGGTLNLIISAVYIAAVVLLVAVPSHLYVAAVSVAPEQMSQVSSYAWLYMAGGAAAAIVVGVLATVIPLRMGVRAFRALEF